MSGLTGAARIAGVIGWPVQHSLSPVLHGYWLEKYKIDGAYVPLAVHENNLEAAVLALPKLGFAGANVTVPHKERVLKLVDHVTATAKRIGAVNTIVCDKDGKLSGDNTDGFGFIRNLRSKQPDWRADQGPAVVFGAGGAARAVIDALQDAGVPEIRLVNRTMNRAEILTDHFGRTVIPMEWADREAALAGVHLLVNTTTLGMAGKPALDISFAGIADEAVVTDIVYAPLKTPLLAAAKAAGYKTVDGLGMLLHQAQPGFKAWFGKMPEVDDALRDHVLAGLPHR